MAYNNGYQMNYQFYPNYQFQQQPQMQQNMQIQNGGFDSVPVMNTDSEFINACSNKGIEGVLGVLDEHMQAIKLLYPKEYDSIIDKIRDL